MNAGAAGGGAAAAAAAAEMARQEEEEMTGYTTRDLEEDWEFKILRSNFGAFGDREKLRQALEEEGRAGWVLVEKFDNQRIRLKRPAAAREQDDYLDFDPYRTHHGMADGKLALLIVGCIFGGLAVVGVFAATMAAIFD